MIDFKTVMGGLAICTIGYSIKLGWGLRKDLTGTSDGAVVVKSDASGKKYVVGEVQMAAPDAERQTTLIELSKLWKDKKDPDNKQDDPKLIKPPSDMSATVQMTTLATMWEQEQANPGKAIDLQLPPFTRQEIIDFYKEQVLTRDFFGLERQAVIEILKILDKDGAGNSSLANNQLSEDDMLKINVNDRGMLAQVNLLDHTLHVAKEIIRSTQRDPIMMEKGIICALGHDIGKIKEYFLRFRAEGGHQNASANVLEEIDSVRDLPYWGEIRESILQHHHSDRGVVLTKELMQADAAARRVELRNERIKREQMIAADAAAATATATASAKEPETQTLAPADGDVPANSTAAPPMNGDPQQALSALVDLPETTPPQQPAEAPSGNIAIHNEIESPLQEIIPAPAEKIAPAKEEASPQGVVAPQREKEVVRAVTPPAQELSAPPAVPLAAAFPPATAPAAPGNPTAVQQAVQPAPPEEKDWREEEKEFYEVAVLDELPVDKVSPEPPAYPNALLEIPWFKPQKFLAFIGGNINKRLTKGDNFWAAINKDGIVYFHKTDFAILLTMHEKNEDVAAHMSSEQGKENLLYSVIQSMENSNKGRILAKQFLVGEWFYTGRFSVQIKGKSGKGKEQYLIPFQASAFAQYLGKAEERGKQDNRINNVEKIIHLAKGE